MIRRSYSRSRPRKYRCRAVQEQKCQKAVCSTGAAQNNEASAKFTTTNGEPLLRAQPDSVANHVTARSISDWRALT